MRSKSIRFRITALATVFVLLGLVVSGIALVVLQRNALTAGIDAALEQRADQIVEILGTGTELETLPGSGDGFAQVVGADGAVIVSTPNLTAAPAVPIGPDGYTVTQVPEVDDDDFRTLTRINPDVSAIVVGTSFDPVGESVTALVASMALIIPILTAIFAALIWWIVGRTLQPVENMRREVAGIGAGDLSARVAELETDDEIGRLAVMLNQMLGRIESSADRQRQFVADASHELRSPLTRLRARLELAGEDPASIEIAEPALLLKEVTGMQKLTEDMLQLARTDTGHGTLELRPLDLDDVVLREGRRLRERGRVEVDMSAVSAAHVVGDPGQLVRAIRNLLENAERYARQTVTLSLNEEAGFGALVISDDGPGIDPSDADRIFERFTRLDESRTTETGGAGLGLAIARDIAERHEGTLLVLPGSGPGAIFELKVPLATASQPGQAAL